MKKKKIEKAFLPVSKDEMVERGWYYYDFLVVTADAYVDHPSFGTSIIARVLEAEGYRVAVLYHSNAEAAAALEAELPQAVRAAAVVRPTAHRKFRREILFRFMAYSPVL